MDPWVLGICKPHNDGMVEGVVIEVIVLDVPRSSRGKTEASLAIMSACVMILI